MRPKAERDRQPKDARDPASCRSVTAMQAYMTLIETTPARQLREFADPTVDQFLIIKRAAWTARNYYVWWRCGWRRGVGRRALSQTDIWPPRRSRAGSNAWAIVNRSPYARHGRAGDQGVGAANLAWPAHGGCQDRILHALRIGVPR